MMVKKACIPLCCFPTRRSLRVSLPLIALSRAVVVCHLACKASAGVCDGHTDDQSQARAYDNPKHACVVPTRTGAHFFAVSTTLCRIDWPRELLQRVSLISVLHRPSSFLYLSSAQLVILHHHHGQRPTTPLREPVSVCVCACAGLNLHGHRTYTSRLVAAVQRPRHHHPHLFTIPNTTLTLPFLSSFFPSIQRQSTHPPALPHKHLPQRAAPASTLRR